MTPWLIFLHLINLVLRHVNFNFIFLGWIQDIELLKVRPCWLWFPQRAHDLNLLNLSLLITFQVAQNLFFGLLLFQRTQNLILRPWLDNFVYICPFDWYRQTSFSFLIVQNLRFVPVGERFNALILKNCFVQNNMVKNFILVNTHRVFLDVGIFWSMKFFGWWCQLFHFLMQRFSAQFRKVVLEKVSWRFNLGLNRILNKVLW